MGIIERLCEVSDKLSTVQSNGINVTDEHIRAVDDGIEEIERLREALEFYANPRTYIGEMKGMFSRYPSPIERDEGEKARKALEGGE